jgi:hypothetical protein
VGARLLYEYDFGDGWQHELLLEEVLLGDETFSRHAWRVSDVVRPKTVEGREDLLSSSKRWRMPITPIMRTSVRGSVILLLNPFPKKRSTGDYVGGSVEQDEGRNKMSTIVCSQQ